VMYITAVAAYGGPGIFARQPFVSPYQSAARAHKQSKQKDCNQRLQRPYSITHR
jgi:hypothetical protein